MRRFLILVLIAVLVGGGAYAFTHRDEIESPSDIVGLFTSALGDLLPASQTGGSRFPPVARDGESIRIATFNIQVLGKTKLSKPHVMDILARIVQQFDVVAVQEIRSQDQSILPTFVDLINASGRHYDYVVGPRIGRSSVKEQYAFIYDTASVEIDRNALFTVADPDDLFHREPLVGWFRVRGPQPADAFTFSLVNFHSDPDEIDLELPYLPDLIRVIQDDGRDEDDVILAGDFNAGDVEFMNNFPIGGLSWVVSHQPTNTRATKQYDNLIFQNEATTEFTGRSGVFDFFAHYNMTLEEALEVSDHLPVWGEFSIYEGGKPGAVASSLESSGDVTPADQTQAPVRFNSASRESRDSSSPR